MNSLVALLSAVAATVPTPQLGNEAAPKTEQPQAQTQAQTSDRICRRVALDIGSRKKEEVCLTAKEWRVFNNSR